MFVEKHIVYTIDQALALLSSIESDSYDCVYMHLFTNDVRNSSVEDCIYALYFLVGKINEVWPSCKIVISAGLPRSDSTEVNDKIYECNIRLLNKYLGTDVQICDNSCFWSQANLFINLWMETENIFHNRVHVFLLLILKQQFWKLLGNKQALNRCQITDKSRVPRVSITKNPIANNKVVIVDIWAITQIEEGM